MGIGTAGNIAFGTKNVFASATSPALDKEDVANAKKIAAEFKKEAKKTPIAASGKAS